MRASKIPPGIERKKLLAQLRSENKKFLSIKKIALICGILESSVERLLYEDKCYPSMFTLFSCYKSVYFFGGTITLELKNIIKNFEQRWTRTARKESFKLSGNPARITKYYFYHGDKMTSQEIVKKSGKTLATVYGRLKKCNFPVNTDVSEIIDSNHTQQYYHKKNNAKN